MLRDPLGLLSFSYVDLFSSMDHSAQTSHDWNGMIVVGITVDLVSSTFHGTDGQASLNSRIMLVQRGRAGNIVT